MASRPNTPGGVPVRSRNSSTISTKIPLTVVWPVVSIRETLGTITQIRQRNGSYGVFRGEENRSEEVKETSCLSASAAAGRSGKVPSGERKAPAGQAARQARWARSVCRSAAGAERTERRVRALRAVPPGTDAGRRRRLVRRRRVPRRSGGGWTMAVSGLCAGGGSPERPRAGSGAARRTAGGWCAGCSRHARDGGSRIRRRRCRPSNAPGPSRPAGGPRATRFHPSHRPPSPGNLQWPSAGITPRRHGSSRSAPEATRSTPTRASRRYGGSAGPAGERLRWPPAPGSTCATGRSGPRPRASAECAGTHLGPLPYLVTCLSFHFCRKGPPRREHERPADPAAGNGGSRSPGVRPGPPARRGPRRRPGARLPTDFRSGSVHPPALAGRGRRSRQRIRLPPGPRAASRPPVR